MTELGVIHLISALYLSAVVCLAVSINEAEEPRRMIRESLRRWLKFTTVAAVIGIVVYLVG